MDGSITVEAKTQRSGLTLAAILDTALEMAAADGLESLTIGEVAKRLGLSKSGVFSRIGSREALQKAVIEEYDRRFLQDVFVPAMREPRGLPRLNAIMRLWLQRARDVPPGEETPPSGCSSVGATSRSLFAGVVAVPKRREASFRHLEFLRLADHRASEEAARRGDER